MKADKQLVLDEFSLLEDRNGEGTSFTPEDAEQILRLLCSGAMHENLIHLRCYFFDSTGKPKRVELGRDPYCDPFCKCVDTLPQSSRICKKWHERIVRACQEAGPFFSNRVVGCPFGLSLMVAPVEYRGTVKAVLFAGNWREVGAEGILHHRLRQADIPQEEKDHLYEHIPPFSEKLLTHEQATMLKSKLDSVVSDVSRLIGLMYARDQTLREHLLMQLILMKLSNLTPKTLSEACVGTNQLLASMQEQLEVEYIVFFTNTGIRNRLDICTSAGLHPKAVEGLYIDGNPLIRMQKVANFSRLNRTEQKEWYKSHFAREGGRPVPRSLHRVDELVPIELGPSFCGILGFGPRKTLTESEDIEMSYEDHRRLVLVARRYLRNGLRDMAERQEVAEMLGKFSHVLRGPLMPLQGAIDALKAQLNLESVDKNFLREVCDDIQNQIEDLSQQADLIEQAKVTGLNERANPQFQCAPLVGVVDRVWQGVIRRAEERGIIVTGFPALRRLPDVQFDWNQMRVVFVNLLHNAVKYSHNNKAIELSGEEINVGGVPWVRVCIADFGTGIHPDEIEERIFLPNFRGSVRDVKRDIEGIGMGLAVCREIVEDVHHGRIWVRCTEEGSERGSYQHCLVEFFVELPINQSETAGG